MHLLATSLALASQLLVAAAASVSQLQAAREVAAGLALQLPGAQAAGWVLRLPGAAERS
jgi:hypothetical protein